MSLIQNLKMIIFLRDRSFVFPHKLSKLIGKCKLGCLEFAFQNIRHSFYSAIKAANLWKLVTINIFLTFSGCYCQTTLEKSMMKFWTGKLICINGFRVSVSTTFPLPHLLKFSSVKSCIKRRRQIAYLASLFWYGIYERLDLLALKTSKSWTNSIRRHFLTLNSNACSSWKAFLTELSSLLYFYSPPPFLRCSKYASSVLEETALSTGLKL